MNAGRTNFHENVVHIAAQKGHREIVKDLLATNALDVNAVDTGGMSAFLSAAETGHVGIVEDLLATRKVDVNGVNSVGSSALHLASNGGHVDVVKLLATVPGINMSAVDDYNASALHHAAEEGHSEILKILLSVPSLADGVNAQNNGRKNPLHYAVYAQQGSFESVRALLACGKAIDINARDTDNKTPLLIAVHRGHTKAAELLAKVPGVDLNAVFRAHPDYCVEHEGDMVLHTAAKKRYHGLLACLASLPGVSAAVNEVNEDGHTALQLAIYQGDYEAVRILLTANGIDANKVSESGFCRGLTPLQIAIVRKSQFGNHSETFKVLVASRKVDVNTRGRHGQTALHHAARLGDRTSLELLLKDERVELNAHNASGRTALHLAYRGRWLEIVRVLESTPGVDSDVVDEDGMSPRQYISAGVKSVRRGRGCEMRYQLQLQSALACNSTKQYKPNFSILGHRQHADANPQQQGCDPPLQHHGYVHPQQHSVSVPTPGGGPVPHHQHQQQQFQSLFGDHGPQQQQGYPHAIVSNQGTAMNLHGTSQGSMPGQSPGVITGCHTTSMFGGRLPPGGIHSIESGLHPNSISWHEPPQQQHQLHLLHAQQQPADTGSRRDGSVVALAAAVPHPQQQQHPLPSHGAHAESQHYQQQHHPSGGPACIANDSHHGGGEHAGQKRKRDK